MYVHFRTYIEHPLCERSGARSRRRHSWPGCTDVYCPPSCASAIDCSGEQYCDFNDVCGDASVGGFCLERPTACGEVFSPVCGCDGISYVNPCSAYSAGTDVAAEGECSTD